MKLKKKEEVKEKIEQTKRNSDEKYKLKKLSLNDL